MASVAEKIAERHNKAVKAQNNKAVKKALKKPAAKVSVKKNKIKVEKIKAPAANLPIVASYPWKSNATAVDDTSVKEMLAQSGLDWTVDRYPVFVEVDGEKISLKKEALLRSDTHAVLSQASEDWNHFDNEVAVEFMDKFTRKLGNRINFLGQVRGGKLIFGLSELQGEKFALFKGEDQISSYLLLSNPHVYGQCFDVRFTAIRDRCFNTFTQGLSRRGDLEVRLTHRNSFDGELAEKALLGARHNMQKYREMAELLASKRYDNVSLNEYYQTVFPSLSIKRRDNTKLSRPGQLAYDHLEIQPGAEFGKGTWWQVYNSATFALDHLVGRNADNRLYASWYGQNRHKKNQALKVACEFANAA